MNKLFYPKPGDTIVCKNGQTFKCVNYEDYPYKEAHPGNAIYAIGNRAGSHMNWKTHEANDVTEGDYAIREIISQVSPTAVETKALCSVLRKAESQGERALVEKMIEICDPQSGLRFEDLWDWWKKHKAQDSVKFDLSRFTIREDQIIKPNEYRVTC